jgi:hypothetical protein
VALGGGRGKQLCPPRARGPPAPASSPPPPPRSGALLERVESRAYSEAYISGLVRSILRFIAQCHAKGIVYRDVKPGGGLLGLVVGVWGFGGEYK